MPIQRFPDPEDATEEGIVAIGGDLHPDSLLLAYRQGIFPWPHEGLPLLWFSPPRRAILRFEELHVPRSLARTARKSGFRFSVDQAFASVIEACSGVPRPGQQGTWITPEMRNAYVRLHELGHAHSVEAWSGEELVGGVYGVDPGGAFAAESMFFRRTGASKLALLHLIEHLRARGLEWLDIQVMTPHMERLGAREVSRKKFLAMLARELEAGRVLFG